MADAIDFEHMARALQLAANGLYDTAPNPAVGCVLVKARASSAPVGRLRPAGRTPRSLRSRLPGRPRAARLRT